MHTHMFVSFLLHKGGCNTFGEDSLMNANDVISAWKDYRIESGEDISLDDFRKLESSKEDRHPARPFKERDIRMLVGGSDRSPFEALDDGF